MKRYTKPPTFVSKFILTTLLLVLIISGFANSTDLTFYDGSELYGDKITLSFHSGAAIRYAEVGENYFLLDELNTSISCSNPIAINVSTVNSGINLSVGTTVLRFNATYSTSEDVTFTFTGNSTAAIYNLYKDDTYSNMYESESFSFIHSDWSEVDFEIELAGYRPDPPYNGSSSYNTTSNSVNFTWNRGNRSDRDVVVRNNDSYPSSPTDGYEVYNGTDTYWNDTSVLSTRYYTVWSFNDTTGYYSSTGLDLEWGALGLNCFNESSGLAIGFDIFITNTDGSQTYEATDLTNTQYVDMLQIPYGIRTSILVSNDSFDTRTYEYDLLVNNFYNLSFYLPLTLPSGEDPDPEHGSLYVLRVIDIFSNPIDNVKLEIKRYINVTEEFQDVAVQYTNPNGYIEIKLMPFAYYKLWISKSGYQTNITWYQPSDAVFTVDFLLYTEEPDITTVSFGDICTFTGDWQTNLTLRIYFYDSYTETQDTTFKLYEVYGDNLTLIETHTYGVTSEITFYNTSALNTSRMHEVRLETNHTTLGHIVNQTIYIMPLHTDKPIDEDWVNTQIEGVFGDFDFNILHFFGLWVPVICFIVLGGVAHHPGLGIVISGAYIALFSWRVNTSIDPTLGVLITMMLLIGAIVIINREGKKLIKGG